MTDGRMYLRKKDLVEAMGMARGTVSDWLTEFSMFIPTVKHGSVTYYRPEVLEVLRAIRELKETGFLFKPEVIQKLVDRGFPITAEEAVLDVEEAFGLTDTRDTMTKVVTELARQKKELDGVEERFSDYDDRMDGQDGRIAETSGQVAELQQAVEDLRRELATMEEMKHQLAEARAEAATAKEQASKPWWKRWR